MPPADSSTWLCPTCGRRVPVCYLSNSYKRRDTTGSCFLAYRDGLYREV